MFEKEKGFRACNIFIEEAEMEIKTMRSTFNNVFVVEKEQKGIIEEYIKNIYKLNGTNKIIEVDMNKISINNIQIHADSIKNLVRKKRVENLIFLFKNIELIKYDNMLDFYGYFSSIIPEMYNKHFRVYSILERNFGNKYETILSKIKDSALFFNIIKKNGKEF